MLNPDMPTPDLLLHMGELTAQEQRTARSAIRWANAMAFSNVLADEDTTVRSVGVTTMHAAVEVPVDIPVGRKVRVLVLDREAGLP